MSVFYDSNCLFKSFYKWKRTSYWKPKTQELEFCLLPELNGLKKSVLNGIYKESYTRPIILRERDKIRYLSPKTPIDSVILTSLAQNTLHDAIYSKLIHNNASSIKGKGPSFFRKQLQKDLHRFWINHGNEGYILLIDFRKYYDNMEHDKIKQMFKQVIKDPVAYREFCNVIDNGRADVSELTQEEYGAALRRQAAINSFSIMDGGITLYFKEETIMSVTMVYLVILIIIILIILME